MEFPFYRDFLSKLFEFQKLKKSEIYLQKSLDRSKSKRERSTFFYNFLNYADAFYDVKVIIIFWSMFD